MRFLSWIWAFIPAPAKAWVILGLVVTGLSLVGFMVYKIDKNGYDRCEAKYASASADQKDEARKEILKSEKQYDRIKTEIIQVQGDNAVCGPRVELAIDRMPGAPNGE